jgi:hypothetical protein
MGHRIAVGAVVLAALAFPSAAAAEVTASSVSSPAEGAGFDVNLDDPELITVTGTATADNPATDMVRIACTYAEDADGAADAIAPDTATGELTPTGANRGTFSVEISVDVFDYYTCRLRAVPSADDLPADYRPFTGPVAHFHGRSTDPAGEPPELVDFYQNISGPLAYWDGYSTSDCFVASTYTLDPATLDYGQLFGCAMIADTDPLGTRAALQVDGHSAFLPAEAHYTFGTITGGLPITGFARSLDLASGDVRLTASEPIVRCADGMPDYPPPCAAWADAGLTDRSTTVGSHGGRVVRHTDVWTNSGPVARELDVWYQVWTANTVQWLFPRDTAYAAHAADDTISLPPPGPGTGLLADDPAETGYQNPRGSITWSSAPSEIRFAASDQLYLHYVRTIPAGSTAAISLTFATDGPQANVDSLSAEARAGMLPTVTITAPAGGTTVGAAAVTVTGTATDDGPVSVRVNGQAATVTADETWSVAVPLQEGANTLVATATDTDGNGTQSSLTVHRPTSSPPPPPPPPPANAPAPSNQFTLALKRPKAGAKAIRATLTVPGPGAIRARLTASVKGAARAVTLADAKKSATAAGKVTLTLRLRQSARGLLRRRHELKARLSVTYTPTGGTALTKAKRVTLRAATKQR